jgi:hypothetical protein
MTEFSLEVFQNEYVAEGTTTMDAIVTVTARGGRTVLAGEAAEVLVIDTSGSMGEPTGRIEAVRQAAAEAIDGIRDGVLFAVIAGTERAAMVFPAWGNGLVVADAASRSAARQAVQQLQAGGGTAMSSWLLAARDLFVSSPASLRHVILLTDGENWENPGMLEATLQQCRGVFQADCRGVGTDWVVHQLRTIASELLGTVDIIPEPSQMADEFRRLMEAAMGRAVASAALRVWCPEAATVNFVRQVAPEVEDLTVKATEIDPRTRQYPLGAWGAEARDYHVSIAVPANDIGIEMLAARVHLATDGDVVGPALVRAIWTDDDAASARINREVAHYTGQAELSVAIQEGLEALKHGDEREATVKLGRATQIAVDSGHEGTVRLLRKVVDVDDERAGTVRIRKQVAKVDEMALDTRSTRTVRVDRGSGAGAGVAHGSAGRPGTPEMPGALGVPGYAAPGAAPAAWTTAADVPGVAPAAWAGSAPTPAGAGWSPTTDQGTAAPGSDGAAWTTAAARPGSIDTAGTSGAPVAAGAGWAPTSDVGAGTASGAGSAWAPMPGDTGAGTAGTDWAGWAAATGGPGSAATGAGWAPADGDAASPGGTPAQPGTWAAGTTGSASHPPVTGAVWAPAANPPGAAGPEARGVPIPGTPGPPDGAPDDDDEMILDTRSTVTTRVHRHAPHVEEADLDTRSTRTVRTVRPGASKPIDDDGAGDS